MAFMTFFYIIQFDLDFTIMTERSGFSLVRETLHCLLERPTAVTNLQNHNAVTREAW